MDAIFLPRLDAAASLASAIDAMKSESVAGFVAEENDKFWLIDARAALRARRDGVATLAEVTPGAKIHRVILEDLEGFEPRSLVWPQRHASSFQKIFDRYQTFDYAALAAVDQRILLLTRHETLKMELMAPDYFCTGKCQHSLPPAKRDFYGLCSICGSSIESL